MARDLPNPIAQPGYINADGDLVAEGSTYSGSPVVGRGGLPVGSSALLLRFDRGQAVLALGGYYAPGANAAGRPDIGP